MSQTYCGRHDVKIHRSTDTARINTESGSEGQSSQWVHYVVKCTAAQITNGQSDMRSAVERNEINHLGFKLSATTIGMPEKLEYEET